MEAMVRRVLLGVMLLFLLGPVTRVHGQRFGALPITLRIDTFVGPKPAGLVPEVTWVVRVQGNEYTLQVMRLEVLAGNTAYFNIIQALTPYMYAFTVHGDARALATLTQASPGQQLGIIANAQLAQLPGLLFLSSIEPLAAPQAAPAPTTGS
jgi:hypothetical protein